MKLNPESKVLEGKIFRALRIRGLEILVRGHPAVIRGGMGAGGVQACFHHVFNPTNTSGTNLQASFCDPPARFP